MYNSFSGAPPSVVGSLDIFSVVTFLAPFCIVISSIFIPASPVCSLTFAFVIDGLPKLIID